MSAFKASADDFITDISALREMLGPVMGMVATTGKQFDDDHLNALKRYATEERTEGTVKYFRIPPERRQEIGRHRRRNEKYRTASTLLPRTFLVSFVSTFDAFIGNLAHAVLASKPETLNSSGKQLSYKELIGFADMDAARRHVVETEVEGLLRKSHSEQIAWLEKFHKNLRDSSWKTFIELTERRNLFVHCHGKVSAQYIGVCKEHGISTDAVQIGETLTARPKYLDEAYKCLFETGVKLSQSLWRKLAPGEIPAADDALMEVTFNLLVDEQYDLAIRLLEFAQLVKCHEDATRRVMLVNLALAYKFSGNDEKCASTLAASDWSACSDNFVTCIAVLSDDFEGAAKAMHRIGKNGSIRQHDYMDWPVFKAFRKSENFLQAYSEIFGSDAGEYLQHEAKTEEADAHGAGHQDLSEDAAVDSPTESFQKELTPVEQSLTDAQGEDEGSAR